MGRMICCTCKKDLGPFAGDGESHGYCEKCYAKALAKLDEMERRASDENDGTNTLGSSEERAQDELRGGNEE